MSNLRKKRLLFIIVTIVTILVGCKNFSKDSNIKIKAGEDISFFIATDIHYLANSLNDGGEAFQKYYLSGDGKELGYIDEIMSTFAYEIKNKKADVLIVSGDLTNNGAKESHLELSKRFKDIESSGTAVYVIPGNHDINNPWARNFVGDTQYKTDYISDKDFSEIYSDFGYKEAISKDKDTLSYLAAPSEEVWLLMLDTNNYDNNVQNSRPQKDGQINQDTLKWIEECSNLAKSNGATIITVMHHNLINHNELFSNGFSINNNTDTIEQFARNGLDLVLSGHIHVQDISSYKKDDKTMYDIVTGSLAVYPQKYGVLKYTSTTSSFDYSTSLLDVESWTKLEGVNDSNLYNFNSYSKEAFGNFAYNMAYEQLVENNNHNEDQIQLMSETMKILNIRYFSGNEYLNSEDVINSEGFKLWTNSPDSFLKRYITSITIDKDTDDNTLHIEVKR